MSEESKSVSGGAEVSPGWQKVGPADELAATLRRRLFAKEKANDLVLVHYKGAFYAMNAWCPHQSGPLFHGDIEEYRGKCSIVCPWHGYAICLKDGSTTYGLQQETFECKVDQGQLFIRCPFDLSLTPRDGL